MANQLASELVSNPPHLILSESDQTNTAPADYLPVSSLVSDTLAKCNFLCAVLAEDDKYQHLAFQVGMFGLEIARRPAATKRLEVKLLCQISELLKLLIR